MYHFIQDVQDSLFSIHPYDGHSGLSFPLPGRTSCQFVFYTGKDSSLFIDSFSLLGKLTDGSACGNQFSLLRVPALILSADRENFCSYLASMGIHEDFSFLDSNEKLLILSEEQSGAFTHLFQKIFVWYDKNPDSLQLLKYSWLYEMLLTVRAVYQRQEKVTADGFSAPLPEVTDKNAMAKIEAYIRRHYMEALSVDGIADLFYISKYHLMREFKRHTGTTIHAFIINERIAHAQTMIAHGMNAGEVSHLVGFSDYSLFYRAFLKGTGVTPKEFGLQSPRREASVSCAL